jgi:hypothetical protein
MNHLLDGAQDYLRMLDHSHENEILDRCEICLGTTAQGMRYGEFVLCLSCNTIENIENLTENE